MLFVSFVVSILTPYPSTDMMTRLIRFRRLSRPDGPWEIAFDEAHLYAKLDGEMAEVRMPAKPWYVRLWRRVFPPRAIDLPLTP